jgi:hypothetical protein
MSAYYNRSLVSSSVVLADIQVCDAFPGIVGALLVNMASAAALNRYWIPHWDIHKKVITQELQYYLGPNATVRPYTLEVWSMVEPLNTGG